MRAPDELLYNYVQENEQWEGQRDGNSCQRLILGFLRETDYDRKVGHAAEAIKAITKNSGKKDIPNTLTQLYEVEVTVRELLPTARDHVVHSLNTYLIGLWLRERLALNIDDFHFQWMLAALFHDIGYPIELASRIITKTVLEPLKKVRQDLGATTGNSDKVRISYSSFGNLFLSTNRAGNQTGKAFHFMQECFNEWGVQLVAEDYYQSIVQSGKVNHGIVSALMLLRYIDLYYQMENPTRAAYCEKASGDRVAMWGQDVFLDYVVPPAAAIFLHSIDGELFGENKISRDSAPLAYLLRLSDALQDWGRPCGHTPTGLPAAHYRLGYSEGRIQCSWPDAGGQNVHGNREKQLRDDLSAIELDEVLAFV